MNKLVWIEIDKKALEHNVAVIRRLIGPDTVMAPAVKSNAYGHGLVKTSRIILEAGADWLAVNSIDEAAILRINKIKKPIIVIGYIPLKQLGAVLDLKVKPVISDLRAACELDRLAGRTGRKIDIHVKLDTGMSRQGLPPTAILDFARKLSGLRNLRMEGLATHFANSDELGQTRVFRRQRQRYFQAVEELGQAGIFIPFLHSANSAAVLLHGSKLGNLVRPGKAVYGHYPSSAVARYCRREKIILKPALSLKTKVVQIKDLPAGTGVSYASTFVTKKKTRAALIPVGYYDGYDRRLSNQGQVLIKGRLCRILGRICMNMFVVDISRVKGVKIEDEVVLIGRQGAKEITVEDLAQKIGTINYEVIARLRESMERKVV